MLKNFFWQKGEEPADWNLFDGEIDVESQQSRGGDCALIEVSEKWAQWTYDFLKKQQDVKNLEIYYTDGSKDFVKDNRSQYEFDGHDEHAQINKFV